VLGLGDGHPARARAGAQSAPTGRGGAGSHLSAPANIYSLGALTHYLLHHNVKKGSQLIVAGVLIWLTNFLIFRALVLGARPRRPRTAPAAGHDGPARLPLPADDRRSHRSRATGARNSSTTSTYRLTNAAAFSPTDTMPLTPVAKSIMGVQSIVSLVTIGLIVSRAVNILLDVASAHNARLDRERLRDQIADLAPAAERQRLAEGPRAPPRGQRGASRNRPSRSQAPASEGPRCAARSAASSAGHRRRCLHRCARETGARPDACRRPAPNRARRARPPRVCRPARRRASSGAAPRRAGVGGRAHRSDAARRARNSPSAIARCAATRKRSTRSAPGSGFEKSTETSCFPPARCVRPWLNFTAPTAGPRSIVAVVLGEVDPRDRAHAPLGVGDAARVACTTNGRARGCQMDRSWRDPARGRGARCSAS